MTKKEAIEIMARRIFMSKYEQAIKVLKILYSDKFQQFTSSEFDDAIYVAIKALEKQIPKQPKEYEDKYYACPNCGNVTMMKWERYPDRLMDKSNGLPYCLGCGQRLDWEGIE